MLEQLYRSVWEGKKRKDIRGSLQPDDLEEVKGDEVILA